MKKVLTVALVGSALALSSVVKADEPAQPAGKEAPAKKEKKKAAKKEAPKKDDAAKAGDAPAK